jgi:hypothetical protein
MPKYEKKIIIIIKFKKKIFSTYSSEKNRRKKYQII